MEEWRRGEEERKGVEEKESWRGEEIGEGESNRRRVGSGDAGSGNPGRRPGFRLVCLITNTILL